MKKTIIILICIFIAIISLLFGYYQSNKLSFQNIKKINSEYEIYFNKELSGSEVATLINKAIDSNERHNIEKDEKGVYINDNNYCIKIFLKFKNVENIYEMESINKAGVEGFVKNFNNSTFKITNYTYNEFSNRINSIYIEEINIGNI